MVARMNQGIRSGSSERFLMSFTVHLTLHRVRRTPAAFPGSCMASALHSDLYSLFINPLNKKKDMSKFLVQNTNLICSLREDSEIAPDKCHTGVISRTPDGYKFEEAMRRGRRAANVKIYDGSHIRLAVTADGKFKVYMKPIVASALPKGHQTAFGIYCELAAVFQMMER